MHPRRELEILKYLDDRSMRERRKPKAQHALQWVFDPLEARDDFLQKRMFGCLAAYLGDRIVLVVAAKETPWNGILIPTDREHHRAVQKLFPMLAPHPVLGKWLYLDQGDEQFEETVEGMIGLIQKGDPRIGVLPKAKKSKVRSRKN